MPVAADPADPDEWPINGVVGHMAAERWVVEWQGYAATTIEPTACLRPSALGNIATYVGEMRVQDELAMPVSLSMSVQELIA
jgi:hypothetical protein